MDRSTSIPFSNGSVDLKLTITGPSAGSDDAERKLDLVFGKAMSICNHFVVPALNSIQDQIDVGEGVTRAETLIELEVLGNDIELDITTVLPNILVDAEMVRAWVAKIVAADFVSFALKVITNDALSDTLESGNVEFKEEHIPSIIGLLIGDRNGRD